MSDVPKTHRECRCRRSCYSESHLRKALVNPALPQFVESQHNIESRIGLPQLPKLRQHFSGEHNARYCTSLEAAELHKI